MTEYVDDIVEKVAEAIWSENAPEFAPPYDALDFTDQLKVRQLALALIRSMRTPTAGMVAAAIGKTAITDIWESMIDAALKEE